MDYACTEYEFINPVGNCVLLEKVKEDDLRMSHGLYLPKIESMENFKIGVAKILKLSNKAKRETSLNEGDFVFYDYYSADNNDTRNVLITYENIFMQVTEEEAMKFLKGELSV